MTFLPAWISIRRATVILPHFLLLCVAVKFETLEECDRQGKDFCLTADHVGSRRSDEAETNKLIEEHPKIRRYILQNLASDNELTIVMGRSKRRRRDIVEEMEPAPEVTECDFLCCNNHTYTYPFTHFRTIEGDWKKVVWTAQYPQATSFREEYCNNECSGCLSVRSNARNLRPVCVTVYKNHTMYYRSVDSDGEFKVEHSTIEVRTSCKCKMWPFGVFGQRRCQPRDD